MLRLSDQRREAGARVLAVARLTREALGEDDDHAVQRRARAGELDQLDRHIVGQARRAARVEAQFDRARHLVDVLPARAGGADKSLDDLALVDEEIADFHGSVGITPLPRDAACPTGAGFLLDAISISRSARSGRVIRRSHRKSLELIDGERRDFRFTDAESRRGLPLS